mmetsp:Transcript_50719/g.147669  ORF Transcript_50719/g.147669 Transcript_50719/m.147669 type:complete len:350 (+) Transcript_50719:268-1317(+)
MSRRRPIAHGLRAATAEGAEARSPHGLLRPDVVGAPRVGQYQQFVRPVQHVARASGAAPMDRVQLRPDTAPIGALGLDADLAQGRKPDADRVPNPQRPVSALDREVVQPILHQQPHALAPEQLHAVEATLVQQHHPEARVVPQSADQAAGNVAHATAALHHHRRTAADEDRRRRRAAATLSIAVAHTASLVLCQAAPTGVDGDERDFPAAAVQRLSRVQRGEAGHLLVRHLKEGVDHAQRFQDLLGQELVQGPPRDDLDDTTQDVGAVAVAPVGAGLKAQRHLGDLVAPLRQRRDLPSVNPRDEFDVRLLVFVFGLVVKTGPEADAAGVSQQVADRHGAAERLQLVAIL